MKRCVQSRSLMLFIAIAFSGVLCLPAQATENVILNSEALALSAYQVAEKTKSTGRCYAAVSRALSPFGVTLTGAAAYEAEGQLRQDRRFVPLIVFSADDLRRGDVIVYSRSQSHPYGHIAVYQGNYREASDHLSALTHTKNYGGATVFRLANENVLANSNSAAQYSRSHNSGAVGVPSNSQNVLRRHPVIRQILRSILRHII